jgi:hypothetical protein
MHVDELGGRGGRQHALGVPDGGRGGGRQRRLDVVDECSANGEQVGAERVDAGEQVGPARPGDT